METINGQWYMKGCETDDPSVLHSINDAISLIHTIGFLPLFSNDIPGFSVEEHVPAESWWTGDEATDPWEWRMILARDPDIVYGKFFNRSAGFISRGFFPFFANYRRNGYDYDALFDDGLASYRSKKVMDVFELDDNAVGKELMSNELKVTAGFGKEGGEKNFEGTFTDLQMQTYLILSDFRQRKNKKGEAYGWHIAAAETPETKWGREFVTSKYNEEPLESWDRICTRMKKHFPAASDGQIRKILGIRWPGGVSAPPKPEKPEKPRECKSTRPQALPWPENLLRELEAAAARAEERKEKLKSEFDEARVNLTMIIDGEEPTVSALTLPKHLSPDQMAGLTYVLATLKNNEQKVIHLRFEEHLPWWKVAAAFDRSEERVRQVCRRALRKLIHHSRLVYIQEGYQAVQDKEDKARKNTGGHERPDQIRILKDYSVYDCGLTVRATNCLVRAGIFTLGAFAEAMDTDPGMVCKIRNLGRRTLLEIVRKVEEYGVDCSEFRAFCEFGTK